MLQGINRQVIFEDDEDRLCFMNLLKYCKKASGFKLYAFCLMSNHVHLLMEPGEEPLEIIFKRVASPYVNWYNQKYDRVGHLFQDRFRNECVENDLYFTTVLRYILQNPIKAGLESSMGSYRWSSYLAYAKGAGSLTDTQYAEKLFESHDALVGFLRQGNDDAVMDEEEFDRRLRKERAKEIIIRITGCESVTDFQRLDPKIQKEYAQKLVREDISASQISLLTGMPKTTVWRMAKKMNTAPDTENAPVMFEPSAYQFDYFDNMDTIW